VIFQNITVFTVFLSNKCSCGAQKVYIHSFSRVLHFILWEKLQGI